ncbi:hypothetical protein PTSG_01328 [Salpingoeca rosetta]|uniref:ER membrane protein complex subunit 6 n=1 Tax=Salpingoeca rosetta (strain ATCC 50818 / BSB-021) TaxID=946362 RepID=F2U010_SALR5|nr:uncharacterized protein PTSG_01328 [Salpingoeca rosetta]EGD80738.1 hypothetical protein PTSG_01328 [Salpingoeca rosetta]|eukprot:XP_004997299.1 hypothetical protein PTSG_01328 [Salpingoeca rosetta]
MAPTASAKDKDAFLDRIYWARQALALLCGITFGAFPLTSWAGFVSFFLVVLLGPLQWAQTMYKSQMALLHLEQTDIFSEGFQPSLFVFMASWILVYTTLYGDFE